MTDILYAIVIIISFSIIFFGLWKAYTGYDEPELNGSTRHKLRKMSKKYGLHIYKSKNPQFPYYVREWDECFTEQEILIHRNNYSYNTGLSTEYGISVWDTHGDTYPYYVEEWDEYFECVGDLVEAVKDWRMTQSLEDGFQE